MRDDREITLICEIDPPVWLGSYEAFLERAIREMGLVPEGFSVTLCADPFIRDLNKRFRNKDEATDVLSFESTAAEGRDPSSRRDLAGDLVISLDTLRVNAEYFSVPMEEELRRVTVHGILHLLGWDHATNEPSEAMLVHQESLLKKFNEVLF